MIYRPGLYSKGVGESAKLGSAIKYYETRGTRWSMLERKKGKAIDEDAEWGRGR
jgi:hypothetical protein